MTKEINVGDKVVLDPEAQINIDAPRPELQGREFTVTRRHCYVSDEILDLIDLDGDVFPRLYAKRFKLAEEESEPYIIKADDIDPETQERVENLIVVRDKPKQRWYIQGDHIHDRQNRGFARVLCLGPDGWSGDPALAQRFADWLNTQEDIK